MSVFYEDTKLRYVVTQIIRRIFQAFVKSSETCRSNVAIRPGFQMQ